MYRQIVNTLSVAYETLYQVSISHVIPKCQKCIYKICDVHVVRHLHNL